jgi:mannose-6-phosphate isomerase-like protein (cupin superfamily)
MPRWGIKMMKQSDSINPNSGEFILEQLGRFGSKLNRTHEMSFWLYFLNEEAARQAADRAEAAGLKPDLSPPLADFRKSQWLCLLYCPHIPDEEILDGISDLSIFTTSATLRKWRKRRSTPHLIHNSRPNNYRERITFEETGAETGGQYLAGKILLAPKGVGPPEHLHPKIEESFRVISGSLATRVAGRQRTYGFGEEFTVPPGTPHRWWNETDEAVGIEYRVSPALPLDRFLENVFAMVRLGYSDSRGLPGPLRMSRVLPRFWDVLYLASPPLPIQKATMVVLGILALILGYRAEYSYPCDRPGTS